MKARRADVVGPVAEAEGRLGRDENLVAAALDRLAEDVLGHAVGIDVGGIEHRDAGVEADIDHAARFGDVGRSPTR